VKKTILMHISRGISIESPWLFTEEAAAYCGLTEVEFIELSKGLPHSGNKTIWLYHVEILDAWIRNRFKKIKKKNPTGRG